jgi:hypothetical protein
VRYARTALLSTAAALVMGAAAWALHRYLLIPHLPGSTIPLRAARVFLTIAFAAGFYFGTTRLLGLGEARQIFRRGS